MPLLLVIFGAALVVTAIRGTEADFVSHLRDDLTGGFMGWVAAIVAIGLLGFIPNFEKPSRMLLALVVLVLLLKQGSGFFDQFAQQISAAPAAKAPTDAVPGSLPAIPISVTGASSGSSAGNAAASAAGSAAVKGIFGLFGG